jgi:hypothetical protein
MVRLSWTVFFWWGNIQFGSYREEAYPHKLGYSHPCQELIEHRRGTSEINIWCGMMKDRIIGPFLFQKATVKSNSCRGMLQHYTMPQLSCDTCYQQNREPPTFWKLSPSVFKLTLSEQMDWKERFPNMALKTTRPNSNGLFPPGFCEECIVYQQQIADLQTLRHRIPQATTTASEVTFADTWHDIE